MRIRQQEPWRANTVESSELSRSTAVGTDPAGASAGGVRPACALRLVIHASRAQVLPVGAGIPWLGFVVYPTHRLVKARKVRAAHRRLRSRLAAYHAGQISYAELDASIQGWINHVRHADSWGLRRHVLETLAIRPAEHRRAVAAQ